MRAFLRWTAAGAALVAGLALGAGSANAATSPHAARSTTHQVALHPATHSTVHPAANRGMQPSDWWW